MRGWDRLPHAERPVRGDAFLGVVRLTDLAHAMADPADRRDLDRDLVGGVTFVVAVGVIARLLPELPSMLHLAGQLAQQVGPSVVRPNTGAAVRLGSG